MPQQHCIVPLMFGRVWIFLIICPTHIFISYRPTLVWPIYTSHYTAITTASATYPALVIMLQSRSRPDSQFWGIYVNEIHLHIHGIRIAQRTLHGPSVLRAYWCIWRIVNDKYFLKQSRAVSYPLIFRNNTLSVSELRSKGCRSHIREEKARYLATAEVWKRTVI